MQTQEQLNYYFAIILHFANKSKVKELLVKLGYQVDKPTAELCVQAFNEYGAKFSQPFGRIAERVIESPKYKAYMKALAKGNSSMPNQLNKATDDNNKLTNEQKVQLGDSIITAITSIFSSGSTVWNSYLNKDANLLNAQAQLVQAQAAANAKNQETTNKWLIPVIIAVIVLIIGGVAAAIIISRKNK
jgi:hypothetical protein